jgi:hypothetical protein
LKRTKKTSQQGFVMAEVIFASLAMLVICAAMISYFSSQFGQASALVLRQQAIYAANAEAERLTALFDFTNFGSTGPQLTTGYTENPALPSSRYIYPSALNTWSISPGNSGHDVQTDPQSISGTPFSVLLISNITPALNRTYIAIDAASLTFARVSWTATPIVVPTCADGGDCLCGDPAGTGVGANCQKITLFLEYPYHVNNSNNLVADLKMRYVTLTTIVGRGK